MHKRWTACTGSTALPSLIKKTIEGKCQQSYGRNGSVEHTARYIQFHDLKERARFAGLHTFQLLSNLGLDIVFKSGIFDIALIWSVTFGVLSRLSAGGGSGK